MIAYLKLSITGMTLGMVSLGTMHAEDEKKVPTENAAVDAPAFIGMWQDPVTGFVREFTADGKTSTEDIETNPINGVWKWSDDKEKVLVTFGEGDSKSEHSLKLEVQDGSTLVVRDGSSKDELLRVEKPLDRKDFIGTWKNKYEEATYKEKLILIRNEDGIGVLKESYIAEPQGMYYTAESTFKWKVLGGMYVEEYDGEDGSTDLYAHVDVKPDRIFYKMISGEDVEYNEYLCDIRTKSQDLPTPPKTCKKVDEDTFWEDLEWEDEGVGSGLMDLLLRRY